MGTDNFTYLPSHEDLSRIFDYIFGNIRLYYLNITLFSVIITKNALKCLDLFT